MKLYFKIIILVTFITFCIGLSTSLLISRMVYRTLEKEMEEKAIVITRSLAEHIATFVINGDVIPVREALHDVIYNTKGVVFAYVVGFDGEIFAHSFDGGIPRSLVAEGHEIFHRDVPVLAKYSTGAGPVLMVGQPLVDGMRACIHIAMSESSMHNQIRALRNNIIGLTFGITLLGIILGVVLSWHITRPLGQLADSMHAFGIGESVKEIDLRGGSAELTELSHSFNRMISQRKRTEDALNRTKEELEKQNVELKKLDKMKDGLIRDVSHELKTPVAKHAMQVEILRKTLEKHSQLDELEKVLNVMEAAIKRQGSVIRNILFLSQLEVGGRKYKIEPVRLDNLLSGVIEDYRFALVSYDIQVGVNLKAVTIPSNREMLWHVFSNLINNAIKCRNTSDPAKIDIFIEQKEKEARVKICDNGVGFSEEEKEKLFSRFYQSSPTTEGIGVGLTISKIIVEELGGRIWLESEGIGKGATAVVALHLL